MSRFTALALAAILLLPATAASATDDGLTNGPNGTQPNTPGSALGFSGINAVAPERELLYHPKENYGPAPTVQAEPDSRAMAAEPVAPLLHRHARHHRRHVARR
jgi:hypothetical protein